MQWFGRKSEKQENGPAWEMDEDQKRVYTYLGPEPERIQDIAFKCGMTFALTARMEEDIIAALAGYLRDSLPAQPHAKGDAAVEE